MTMVRIEKVIRARFPGEANARLREKIRASIESAVVMGCRGPARAAYVRALGWTRRVALTEEGKAGLERVAVALERGEGE